MNSQQRTTSSVLSQHEQQAENLLRAYFQQMLPQELPVLRYPLPDAVETQAAENVMAEHGPEDLLEPPAELRPRSEPARITQTFIPLLAEVESHPGKSPSAPVSRTVTSRLTSALDSRWVLVAAVFLLGLFLLITPWASRAGFRFGDLRDGRAQDKPAVPGNTLPIPNQPLAPIR